MPAFRNATTRTKLGGFSLFACHRIKLNGAVSYDNHVLSRLADDPMVWKGAELGNRPVVHLTDMILLR